MTGAEAQVTRSSTSRAPASRAVRETAARRQSARSAGSRRTSPRWLRARVISPSSRASVRSTPSITTRPISRRRSSSASESASATSASVRIMVSGVRSSWLALATKRRCESNASAKRSSMPSTVSARRRTSSAGPSSSMRSSRRSPETRSAVAVIRRRGASARPASHQPATMARTIVPAKASANWTARSEAAAAACSSGRVRSRCRRMSHQETPSSSPAAAPNRAT
jgi:hypothetical protein